MVNCGVIFEVQTEFLNIISTSFGFKGLNQEINAKEIQIKTFHAKFLSPLPTTFSKLLVYLSGLPTTTED
jgi:hypothetical protein